jgi:hypothetical protein
MQVVDGDAGAPDITISRGVVDRLTNVAATSLGHRFVGEKAFLDFDDVCFNVLDGSTIVVDVPADADPRTVMGSVFGPVLGVTLLQRRALLLHASAARVDGLTIGMAGESGIGKSTLAGWCFLSGHTIITDDILAISQDDEAVRAVPAYPIVKLWDDGAAMLGLDPEKLDIIEPGFDKRALDVSASFASGEMALDALVMIERVGSAPTANRVRGRGALMALEEASYGLSSLHASGQTAEHFQRAATLAARLPIIHLSVPADASVSRTLEYVVDAARGFGDD